MTKTFTLLATLLAIIVIAEAIDLKVIAGQVPYDQAHQTDLNQLRLAINFNARYVYPYLHNTFSLPNLPVGRNFIQVVSNNFAYPLLMIDSRPNGDTSYSLVNPFTKQVIERVYEPISIKPLDRIVYLYEQAGFSLTGMLFSGPGMFILVGAGLFLCYKTVMPKLQEAQMAPQARQ